MNTLKDIYLSDFSNSAMQQYAAALHLAAKANKYALKKDYGFGGVMIWAVATVVSACLQLPLNPASNMVIISTIYFNYAKGQRDHYASAAETIIKNLKRLPKTNEITLENYRTQIGEILTQLPNDIDDETERDIILKTLGLLIAAEPAVQHHTVVNRLLGQQLLPNPHSLLTPPALSEAGNELPLLTLYVKARYIYKLVRDNTFT